MKEDYLNWNTREHWEDYFQFFNSIDYVENYYFECKKDNDLDDFNNFIKERFQGIAPDDTNFWTFERGLWRKTFPQHAKHFKYSYEEAIDKCVNHKYVIIEEDFDFFDCIYTMYRKTFDETTVCRFDACTYNENNKYSNYAHDMIKINDIYNQVKNYVWTDRKFACFPTEKKAIDFLINCSPGYIYYCRHGYKIMDNF